MLFCDNNMATSARPRPPARCNRTHKEHIPLGMGKFHPSITAAQDLLTQTILRHSSQFFFLCPVLSHYSFIMASYYDLATYDAEEELEKDPYRPPMINLFAAAACVGQLLNAHDLQYSVMGGFVMVCRGSPRTTTDVDIATNASMKQLWKMMEPEPGCVRSITCFSPKDC